MTRTLRFLLMVLSLVLLYAIPGTLSRYTAPAPDALVAWTMHSVADEFAVPTKVAHLPLSERTCP